MVTPIPPLEPFLTYARFRFHLQVKTLMVLPPYKGAVFRGVFGAALRRLVCMARDSDCTSCPLREKCLYVALFEPPPPADYADAGKFRQAPRPYVLNPPLTTRQTFHPGDTLDFELVLLGPAVEALPYFIHIFQELGRRGLGRERGRFELLEVAAVTANGNYPVYARDQGTLAPFAPEAGPVTWPGDDQVREITLEFLTPVRLKEKADLVTRLDFPQLFAALSRRLQLLAAFYGNRAALPDLAALQRQAATISVTHYDLHWFDWERYSRRQETAMKLGGLRGQITFGGPMAAFLPYLRLGEQVHIGQGNTFGLGYFKIL